MSSIRCSLSVLLPVYNAEKTLKAAVDSILAQSFTDYEFLIIDDGSTDSSVDIINSYSDKRIQLIELEKNQGLISALNFGLQIATGKYLARMDADDIAFPERLATQIEFMESNQEIIACGSSIVNFNEKSESEITYPNKHNNIVVSIMLFERALCHPTMVLRLDLLKKHSVKYDTQYPYCEDYALWIELSRYGKLANIEEPLLKYYRHAGQVSKTKAKQQSINTQRLLTNKFPALYETEDLILKQYQELALGDGDILSIYSNRKLISKTLSQLYNQKFVLIYELILIKLMKRTLSNRNFILLMVVILEYLITPRDKRFIVKIRNLKQFRALSALK